MKLQDIMIRDVVQAMPEENVGAAAKRMREKSVGCLVVTIAGAIKGIITDRDLLDCLAEFHDPSRCPVSAHMNRPVIILGPEEDHKAEVISLQSAQSSRIQLKRPAEPPAAADERTRRLEASDNGKELIDAAGPG